MLRRRASTVLAAALLGAAAAAPAHALPGDPPFTPLAPADGAAVPVQPNGIPVSFTCPVYRIDQIGDFPLFGGPTDTAARAAGRRDALDPASA